MGNGEDTRAGIARFFQAGSFPKRKTTTSELNDSSPAPTETMMQNSRDMRDLQQKRNKIHEAILGGSLEPTDQEAANQMIMDLDTQINMIGEQNQQGKTPLFPRIRQLK